MDPTAPTRDPQDAIYEPIAEELIETVRADAAAGTPLPEQAAEASDPEAIYAETAERLIEGMTRPPGGEEDET